jgi:hypothetical protein
MRLFVAAAVIGTAITPAPAMAGPDLVIYALQRGKEDVRYARGVPTITLDGEHGGVQIEALPFDHGGLSFSVALFNGGKLPATIDINSIRVSVEGKPVALLSRDQLERKAENRARWAQIGVTVVGALATTAAANQRDTYRSTLRTPYGTYRSTISVPSTAGQIQAVGIAAGTGVALSHIQNRLDATIDQIGSEALQITTIDPERSYAGRIVTVRIAPKTLPATIDITVNWYGEDYRFGFQVAKPGSPLPPFVSRLPAPAEPEAPPPGQ